MYQVIWDDDVYSEVASTWLDAKSRVAVIDAVHQIDEALKRDPKGAGTVLSEGLLWVDCRPIRAIYSIDESAKRVKVHRIRQIEAGNGRHNPVAEFDCNVIKRATGDLGLWLGSSESRINRCWVTATIQDCDDVYKLSRNQIVDRVREAF